ASADAVAAEVAEADRAGADAVAAEVAETDRAGADVVAADSEATEATPTGPDDHDTVRMPPVGGVPSGDRHPLPQLPEQQGLRPAPGQIPAAKEKRPKSLALAATALAALLIGAWFFGANRDDSVTAQSAPTVTATATAAATATMSKAASGPSDESTDSAGEASTIQLEPLAKSARPNQTVPVQGRFRGGEDTLLRVQYLEGGKWL